MPKFIYFIMVLFVTLLALKYLFDRFMFKDIKHEASKEFGVALNTLAFVTFFFNFLLNMAFIAISALVVPHSLMPKFPEWDFILPLGAIVVAGFVALIEETILVSRAKKA